MNQLITSYTPFSANKILAEAAVRDNKPLIVSGILQKAEEKNHNGRVYGKLLLERETKKYQEVINENRALGELDHPDSSIINLNNVSHRVVKLWWEGNNCYGDIEILNTPSGNILKNLFAHGVNVGISSRGMGSVEENDEGILIVQEDFDLLCWDFVSTPSTKGGYMYPKNTRMNESVNPNNTNPYKFKDVHNIIRDIICDNTGNCKC